MRFRLQEGSGPGSSEGKSARNGRWWRSGVPVVLSHEDDMHSGRFEVEPFAITALRQPIYIDFAVPPSHTCTGENSQGPSILRTIRSIQSLQAAKSL